MLRVDGEGEKQSVPVWERGEWGRGHMAEGAFPLHEQLGWHVHLHVVMWVAVWREWRASLSSRPASLACRRHIVRQFARRIAPSVYTLFVQYDTTTLRKLLLSIQTAAL